LLIIPPAIDRGKASGPAGRTGMISMVDARAIDSPTSALDLDHLAGATRGQPRPLRATVSGRSGPYSQACSLRFPIW
jgi:hypothetical protein